MLTPSNEVKQTKKTTLNKPLMSYNSIICYRAYLHLGSCIFYLI